MDAVETEVEVLLPGGNVEASFDYDIQFNAEEDEDDELTDEDRQEKREKEMKEAAEKVKKAANSKELKKLAEENRPKMEKALGIGSGASDGGGGGDESEAEDDDGGEEDEDPQVAAMGLGIETNFEKNLHSELMKTAVTVKTVEDKSHAQFTLADEDGGDFFVVQIYKDPYYGVPLFYTG